MTNRMTLTLDDYMDMPWVPTFHREPDGSYRATVEPLKNFEVFGPKALVEAEWRVALKGYLRACLATQKAIPLPPNTYETKDVGTGVFYVGWSTYAQVA